MPQNKYYNQIEPLNYKINNPFNDRTTIEFSNSNNKNTYYLKKEHLLVYISTTIRSPLLNMILTKLRRYGFELWLGSTLQKEAFLKYAWKIKKSLHVAPIVKL